MNTKLMLLVVMVAISSGSVYADEIVNVDQPDETEAPPSTMGTLPFPNRVLPFPNSPYSGVAPAAPRVSRSPIDIMKRLSSKKLCEVKMSALVFGLLPIGTGLVYENKHHAEIPFVKVDDDRWFGGTFKTSPPRSSDRLWVKYAKIPCSKLSAYRTELRKYRYLRGQRMDEIKERRATRAQAANKVLRKQWEDEYMTNPLTQPRPN